MNEIMSLAEIEAWFESEWVLLENPQTTESLEVKSGKVLWHSKDRDEVDRKALELRPKHSAISYTWTLPEGLLGLDFFRGQRLVVDFRKGLVTLE